MLPKKLLKVQLDLISSVLEYSSFHFDTGLALTAQLYMYVDCCWLM